ncbi:MAG: alpha/beta hydrolase [Myxococcota bacterium]
MTVTGRGPLADGTELHLPEQQRLRANDLDHAVLRWKGSGPNVLLCHGYLDMGFSWTSVATRLQRCGYDTAAFDWRGHGTTEWVGAGGYYHFPDYVLDLHELTQKLFGGEEYHLVGHSMGGSIACMFASTLPIGLRTLTTIEGLGPPDENADHPVDRLKTWIRTVEGLRKSDQRAAIKDVDEAVRRMRVRNPTLPDKLGRFLAEQGTKLNSSGSREWTFDPLHRSRAPIPFRKDMFLQCLDRIAVPTLVVGSSNGFRLSDEQERIDHIEDTTVVEIQDVGHMVHWFAAEELASAIDKHIRRSAKAT